MWYWEERILDRWSARTGEIPPPERKEGAGKRTIRAMSPVIPGHQGLGLDVLRERYSPDGKFYNTGWPDSLHKAAGGEVYSEDLKPIDRVETFEILGHKFTGPPEVAEAWRDAMGALERESEMIEKTPGVEDFPEPEPLARAIDVDPRPMMCSRRLHDRGHPAPRSGCKVAGCTMFNRMCHGAPLTPHGRLQELRRICDTLDAVRADLHKLTEIDGE